MEPEANPETGAEDVAREDLAKLLNSQEPDEANPDEQTEEVEQQPEAEPEYTVKIDGKEERVKLSELQSGYQRDADYRTKTMALADERRAVDNEKAKASQAQQQYGQALGQLIQRLEADQGSQVDWQKLLDTNPQEYLRQRHSFDQKQATLAQARIAQHENNQKIQQQEGEETQRFIEAQAQILVSKLPEWKNEAKAKAEQGQLAQYLHSQGYDPKQIASIVDHKDVLLTRKAMLYDRLMSKKPDVDKKVQRAPARAESSGTPQTEASSQQFNDAMRRLNKSGSREDGRRALRAFLGDRK